MEPIVLFSMNLVGSPNSVFFRYKNLSHIFFGPINSLGPNGLPFNSSISSLLQLSRNLFCMLYIFNELYIIGSFLIIFFKGIVFNSSGKIVFFNMRLLTPESAISIGKVVLSKVISTGAFVSMYFIFDKLLFLNSISPATLSPLKCKNFNSSSVILVVSIFSKIKFISLSDLASSSITGCHCSFVLLRNSNNSSSLIGVLLFSPP